MKTVAVIFGGRSAEHDISIVTALSSIIKPLQLSGNYNVVPVYITKDGNWYSSSELANISLFSGGTVEDYLSKSQPIQVQFNNGLTIVSGKGFKRKETRIDIVFPAMHGTNGEDGSLQGLLEMANIPYVGCGVDASAIAMDKTLAKQVAQQHGIPVSKFIAIRKEDFTLHPDQIVDDVESNLTYPLFVKPSHLGSSIGISRAASREELLNAIEVAVHYDQTAIIEEEVPNLVEVTLPIIGNTDLMPGLLERPLTSAEDFFDFETKYMNGGKKGGKKGGTNGSQGYSELPAKLPKDLYAKAEQIGLTTYKALGCSGIARVDMLIDSVTETVYFNEVNPLPGSLYAHNWRAAGVPSVDLVQKLIDLAVEKHAAKKSVATAFTTNFLKQF